MRRPDLLGHKSYDNSRQTLQFLRDKGLNETGARKLFSKYPALIWSSFQGTVKPKVEFLERIGLTGQKLLKALHRSPRFLLANVSRTLEPKACFLQPVLDPYLAAVVSNPESNKIVGKVVSNHNLTASVISECPRILSWPTEKILMGFVKDIEGMGIEKGSKAFARCFSRLCRLNRDTVKRKLENLRDRVYRRGSWDYCEENAYASGVDRG